jgi:hypothetical protein
MEEFIKDFNGGNIAELIYKEYEERNRKEPRRDYLGVSVIGNHCDRYVWLYFRQSFNDNFPGRVLRMFERGKNEEAIVYANLRSIGCTVDETQQAVKHGHYIAGHIDGTVLGIPGAEKTLHLLEIKTASDSKFKEFQKLGIAANPQYEIQCQVYMRLLKLTRCLFFVVNKNDDDIFCQRLELDKNKADHAIGRAERIINASTPPAGVSDNPAFYKCKLCPAQSVCHKFIVPEKNCKNCCFSTPTNTGWVCDKGHEYDSCIEHLFIPPIIGDKYEFFADGYIKYSDMLYNVAGSCFPLPEMKEGAQII